MTETDDVSRALTGWYLSLAARSNAAFLPLYFDTHRYLVLKGGGGSGKSVFAATKLLERCLAEPGVDTTFVCNRLSIKRVLWCVLAD